MNKTKDNMVQLCQDFPIPKDFNVVIKKPYIPWVPETWNRILVLAESQNLSKNNSAYVESLNAWSEEKQICRLYNVGNKNDLGIAPWDDGSLKLALEAAFNKNSNLTAVSNAVLWSQVTESNANITPSPYLIKTSVELWAQLLPVLQPELLVKQLSV